MGRYSVDQLKAHVEAKAAGDPKQIAETGIELINAALHGGKLDAGQFPPLFKAVHGEKLKAPKIARCQQCANREAGKLRNVKAQHEKTLLEFAAQSVKTVEAAVPPPPVAEPQGEPQEQHPPKEQTQAPQVEQRAAATPAIQDTGLIPKVGKFEQGQRFATLGEQPSTIVGFSTNKRKVVLLKADGSTIEITLEHFKETYKAA